MRLPRLLPLSHVARRHRYVAVERRQTERPDAERRRRLARLRERYVRGELTLPEYEAELARALRATPDATPDPIDRSAPLGLRPQAGDLGVACGAGVALLLSAGVVLAHALRRSDPSRPRRASAQTAQALLTIDAGDVLTAYRAVVSWHVVTARVRVGSVGLRDPRWG